MSDRHFEHMTVYGQIFAAAETDDGRLEAIMEAQKIPVTVTNRARQTLAHVAAKFGNLGALKYVLEKEPRLLDQTDGYHCTVLHIATIRGSLEVVKYLVEEHRADITRMSGRYKDRTALHAAVEFNRLNILKYFVEECNVDVNKPNPDQTIPPLFLAVRNRNWDVIEYLVEDRHANVRMLKSNEENILFVIVRENFLNLMKYLLDEKRIDFNVDWKNCHGETPVHVAAILNRLEILEYLVDEKYANVNTQKRTDKRTPLHYAASRDHFEVCKFLVERGADARVQDTYGDIPADKAKDASLVEFLEHAAKVRSPRSVPSPILSAGEPVPPPFSDSGQRKSIGYLPRSIHYIDGAESFAPETAVNVSFFQNFLFLAKSITKIARSNNSVSIVSPPSVVRNKMSSIAIDAIDSRTNFRKF